MTSTKIKVGLNGLTLAHPAAKRGYAGQSPIVEVTDTDGVQPRTVIAALKKVIVLRGNSIMYAESPLPWALIADAHQGQIVRLEG